MLYTVLALGQKHIFPPSVYIPKSADKRKVSWKHMFYEINHKLMPIFSYLYETCINFNAIVNQSHQWHKLYCDYIIFKLFSCIVEGKEESAVVSCTVLVFLGKWWSISVYTVSGWCMAVHIAAPRAQHCSQLLRQLLPRRFKTYFSLYNPVHSKIQYYHGTMTSSEYETKS